MLKMKSFLVLNVFWLTEMEFKKLGKARRRALIMRNPFSASAKLERKV